MKSFILTIVLIFKGLVNVNGGLLDTLVSVGTNGFRPLLNTNVNYNFKANGINLPSNNFRAVNDMNRDLNLNSYNKEYEPIVNKNNYPRASYNNNGNVNTGISQNKLSDGNSERNSDIGNVYNIPNKDEEFPPIKDRFTSEEEDNTNKKNDFESDNNDDSSITSEATLLKYNDVETGKSLIDVIKQKKVESEKKPIQSLSSLQKLAKDKININALTIPQIIGINIPYSNQNGSKVEGNVTKDKENLGYNMEDKEVKKNVWVMLKKKKFIFQMQPVRPESEIIVNNETVYYLE